jgi:hypothetical protein
MCGVSEENADKVLAFTIKVLPIVMVHTESLGAAYKSCAFTVAKDNTRPSLASAPCRPHDLVPHTKAAHP